VEERTRKLEAAQSELVRKEKFAALGQLTATVSHEIRNPLGTIRTSLFSVADALERHDMARVDRALSLAERSIIRCDRIIEELLDFTRERELNPRLVDIDGWMEEIINDHIFPDDVEIEQELNTGVSVAIDREHLRRSVNNLIINALQALQGEKIGQKRITVKTSAADGKIEIHISDSGPGMPTEVLERVFEPLFSTKGFGVGLGLPIVKNIVEEHSGGVEIHSEVGKGTTAVLWVPVMGSKTKDGHIALAGESLSNS
jgi:signal transduction histidine kinase